MSTSLELTGVSPPGRHRPGGAVQAVSVGPKKPPNGVGPPRIRARDSPTCCWGAPLGRQKPGGLFGLFPWPEEPPTPSEYHPAASLLVWGCATRAPTQGGLFGPLPWPEGTPQRGIMTSRIPFRLHGSVTRAPQSGGCPGCSFWPEKAPPRPPARGTDHPVHGARDSPLTGAGARHRGAPGGLFGLVL